LTPVSRPAPPWLRPALAGLLLASAGLRLWLALPDAHAGRWFDEKINVANVVELLDGGGPRPRNFWYGGLSYVPQVLVLALARGAATALGEERLEVLRGGELTPTGYRLCRLLQVAYGVLSLWVVFAVGRAVFTAPVGLLAALLLAVSERHLHASAIFKPDILLLLTSLAAFLWSVRAVRAPRPGNFLLAGAGVGLAAASKLNGVTVAAPLLVAGGLLAWRDRRLWPRLGLAALAAAAVYLALNPFVGETWRALEENRRHYAELATGGRAAVLVETLGFLFDPAFHGPLVATLAVAGFLLLGRRLLAKGAATPAALPGAMLLLYPPAYVLIYALATTRAKENHFLQVLPFTSLLAALAVAAGWEGLARRLSPVGRRGMRLAAVPLLLGLALEPVVYVYRQVTPPTWELAADSLRQALPEPRTGRAVVAAAAFSPRDGLGSALLRVERLADAGEAALDLADAEVFPASALEGEAGEFHRRRHAAAAGPIRVARRWFGAWGPDLVVLLHPWRLDRAFTAPPLDIGTAAGAPLSVALPAGLEPGDVVSVQVRLPARPSEARGVELAVGPRRLALLPVRRVGAESVWLTPRFALDEPLGRATLELPGRRPDRGAVRLTFRRWLAPLRAE
jgi:4-amino-4-deoxy-L-arabinose transferase-like glycosyltransferase